MHNQLVAKFSGDVSKSRMEGAFVCALQRLGFVERARHVGGCAQ